MDPIFSVPELTSLIFDHLNKPALISCALVCKSWNELALDKLWKELDSLVPLISLLTPLKKSEDDSSMLEFTRPIRAWGIFDRYARRVRSLDLDDELSTLSASIFYEIALKRLSPVLLPNLSRLKIMVDGYYLDMLSYSLLFTEKNIEEFALVLPYPYSNCGPFQELIPDFFEECAIRMPRLRIFELYSIYSHWPVATIENHVALFLSSLPKLVNFKCSVHFTTPCIANALSRLPSLRSIEFKTEGDIGSGLQSDVMVFEPLIAFTDAFHALSVFEVSATFDDMRKLLEKDFALGLDKLFIHSPQLESAESLHQCLCALPKQRPWLRSLHLDSVNEADEPLMNDYGQEIDCVTLETLEHVLDFPRLIDFLEVLWLCIDPVLDQRPILTPAVLPMLARRCPRLRHLALYLNTHFDDPWLPSQDTVESVRFISLEEIKFGTSPITDEDISEFAFYLSRVLPQTCSIGSLCGVYWLRRQDLEDLGHCIEPEFLKR
ncbi:hypothetical protein ACEPAI_1900 [Sanghuangporus weigelae]